MPMALKFAFCYLKKLNFMLPIKSNSLQIINEIKTELFLICIFRKLKFIRAEFCPKFNNKFPITLQWCENFQSVIS